MLPKYRRVIVWVDSRGTLTATTAAEAGIRLHYHRGQDLKQRGFRPLFHFRAPLRRLRMGWGPLYRAFAKRAVEFGL